MKENLVNFLVLVILFCECVIIGNLISLVIIIVSIYQF